MSDLDEFKNTLQIISNNKLCEIIVANRYLGVMREEAIASMEELARRRVNGDEFKYESHIEQLLESLPKFNLDISNVIKLPRIF